MTDNGNTLPDGARDKYEYFRQLPLNEVVAHIVGLTIRFEEVQRHYTGPLGRFRRKIRDEDMHELYECIGDLLPMSSNDAVQNELMSREPTNPDRVTFDKIGVLSTEIMVFAARFENSGITVLTDSVGSLD